MKFQGEFVVESPREEVWKYFNDPKILEECAPGCKEMTLGSPSEIQASLEVGVGSVKPAFEVDAVVIECSKPERLEIQASGEASRNSFTVTAWQELKDNNDGTTTVVWEANTEISGVIASLGERAIESVTNKLVNEFFEDIEDHVQAGTPAEAKLQAAGQEEVERAQTEMEKTQSDGVIQRMFELLSSLRGTAGSDGDESDRSNAASYILAGAAVLLVLLWSLMRNNSQEVDATVTGTQSTAQSPVERSRSAYLFVGAALGAGIKTLWNRRSDIMPLLRTATTSGEAGDPNDSGHIMASETSANSETTTGAVKSATENNENRTHRQPEEGLIEDPLERLN